MADAALFGGRRDDVDLAQLFQLPLQGRQSRGVNPIVVGQQNQQGSAALSLRPDRCSARGSAAIHYEGFSKGFNGRITRERREEL